MVGTSSYIFYQLIRKSFITIIEYVKQHTCLILDGSEIKLEGQYQKDK